MGRVCPSCLVMRLWSRIFERKGFGKSGALEILCRALMTHTTFGQCYRRIMEDKVSQAFQERLLSPMDNAFLR